MTTDAVGGVPSLPGSRGAGPAQQAANAAEIAVAVPQVLDVIQPGLGSDTAFVEAVIARARTLQPKPLTAHQPTAGVAYVVQP